MEEDLETDPTFVDTLLDIGEETQFLAETKDIRDELNMISMVLKHQLSIQDDLHKALLEELKGNHNHQRQAEIKKRFREQQKLVENHLKDVERMDKQAEGIYTSVRYPRIFLPNMPDILTPYRSSHICSILNKNTPTRLRHALHGTKPSLQAVKARPLWFSPS